MNPEEGRPTRRWLLRLGVGLLPAGLAGCQLLGGESGEDGTATAVPPAAVDDGATAAGADADGEPSTPTTRSPSGASVVDKLAPPERDDGAYFGTAVDLDGDRAIVGASRDRADGVATGAAHVFTKGEGSWRHDARLRHPRPREFDGFGRSVALAGRTALVGAPGVSHGAPNRSGAAYLFRREGGSWSSVATLRPNDGQGERFGTGVHLRAQTGGAPGTALVAALPTSRIDAPLIGSAYVFARTEAGWTQRARLQPPTGGQRNVFGSSIAMAADRVLVGAPWTRDEEGMRTGSVFQFVEDAAGWDRAGVFGPATGSPGGAFGESLALTDSTAAIGSPGFLHPNGDRAGAVTILERVDGAWEPRESLLPPDGGDGDRFARALGFGGDVLVVGAPQHDTASGTAAGAAYIFRPRDGSWRLGETVTMPSGNPDARFGRSVALDGEMALVGAIGDRDVDDKRVGSAVLVDLGADG